ncbi:class I SAM-dependent methyltransferase [Robertmurraya massiliosenegalensis]
MSNKEAKNLVKNVFGKNAEKYVTSESHSQGTDLPLIVEWLNPKSDSIVLDIATGGGHVAKTLSPHVATVLATDLTKEMLSNTAKHLRTQYKNIHYVLADAESLPFLDNTFDEVTCRIAPHHFPNPGHFIREVSRVLKPRSQFLLIDNIAPEDSDKGEFMNQVEKLRDKSHGRCLSISEWRKLFQNSDLEEGQSRQRKKKFMFPVWVNVTTENQEQRDEVEQLLLSATEELKEYFAIEIVDGEVQSHEIDEWMVLCKKK